MADTNMLIWSVHDVFVQTNAVHGYRYLDLSGVVLNILTDRYRNVNLIAPTGTSLSHPSNPKDPFEVQFGPSRIWLHYVEVDALQKVEVIAPEMMKSIAEKLEMKEFDRFGVRVVYYVVVKDVQKAADMVTQKLMAKPISEFVATRRLDTRTSLEIPLVYNDLDVIFRFRWIVIPRLHVNPQDNDGNNLILDIDVGQRKEDASFRGKDFKQLMSKAIETQAEILVKYGQPLLKGIEV